MGGISLFPHGYHDRAARRSTAA